MPEKKTKKARDLKPGDKIVHPGYLDGLIVEVQDICLNVEFTNCTETYFDVDLDIEIVEEDE